MNLFGRDKNKEFWQWFSKNSDKYFEFESNQDELFSELSKRLRRVSKYACFEFSSNTKGKREFIISADGIRAGAQDVIGLVASAPVFDKWEIIAFRPRKDIKHIVFDGRTLYVKDIAFTYKFNEHNLVDLDIYIKDYQEKFVEEYLGPLFVLMDALVGEYDAMTKIGIMEYHNLSSAPKSGLKKFSTLPELLDQRRSNEIA